MSVGKGELVYYRGEFLFGFLVYSVQSFKYIYEN